MAATRKSSILLELKGTFFYETERLDLTKAQALPDTKYIISRLLTMMKDKFTMEVARIEDLSGSSIMSTLFHIKQS